MYGANSAVVWFGGYTRSPAVGVPAFPQMLPDPGYVNVAYTDCLGSKDVSGGVVGPREFAGEPSCTPLAPTNDTPGYP